MKQLAYILILFFALTACGEKHTIIIATKPMVEQEILASILQIRLQQKSKYNIHIAHDVIDGTTNLHPTIMKGNIDIYPEYTGTAWYSVLNKQIAPDKKTMYQQISSIYKQKYNLIWSPLLGFSNNYVVVTPDSIAKKHNLQTIADLAAIDSTLTFGAERDFYFIKHGYTALCDTYQLKFKDYKEIEIGLKYKAMQVNNIDVMCAFSTDGGDKALNLKYLTDSKDFFPPYQCGFIVRKEIYEKYPAIRLVFDELAGKITDTIMAQMNQQVTQEGKTPHQVAEWFVENHLK